MMQLFMFLDQKSQKWRHHSIEIRMLSDAWGGFLMTLSIFWMKVFDLKCWHLQSFLFQRIVSNAVEYCTLCAFLPVFYSITVPENHIRPPVEEKIRWKCNSTDRIRSIWSIYWTSIQYGCKHYGRWSHWTNTYYWLDWLNISYLFPVSKY